MDENAEYEKFAQEIYQRLLTNDGLTTSVKHNVKLQGAATKHQIDVLWEYTFAGVEHKIAIECKNYSSKLSIGKVRDFHSVLRDIGSTSGIMLTKVGFQKGAKEYADYYGINLKVFRTPKPEDWKGRLKSLSANVEVISQNAKKYFIQLDKDWCKKNMSEEKMNAISVDLTGLNSEIYIYDSSRKPIKNLLQLQDELPINKSRLNNNEHFYNFDDAYVKCMNSQFVKIVGVYIKFDTSISKTRWRFDSEKVTKAILQDALTGEIQFIK